jgi:hypothetical protein
VSRGGEETGRKQKEERGEENGEKKEGHVRKEVEREMPVGGKTI